MIIWNCGDAHAIARRRWHVVARARLVKGQDVGCRAVLAALPRRLLCDRCVVRHLILLAERATQVGVEDVIPGRGVDGTARAGTNNNVNVVRGSFFQQWWIVVDIWSLLIKAKESRNETKNVSLTKLQKLTSRTS